MLRECSALGDFPESLHVFGSGDKELPQQKSGRFRWINSSWGKVARSLVWGCFLYLQMETFVLFSQGQVGMDEHLYMGKKPNSLSKCTCKPPTAVNQERGAPMPCSQNQPNSHSCSSAQLWDNSESLGNSAFLGPLLNSGKYNGFCKGLKIGQLYLGSLVIEPSSIPSVNMWFPNFQDLTAAVRSCQLCPLLTALWLKYLKRLHNPQRQFIPTFLCLM